MVKTDKEEIKDLKKRVTAIEHFITKDGISKNGRLVHCDCGNSWIYRGHKQMATCTNCGKKIKIEENAKQKA